MSWYVAVSFYKSPDQHGLSQIHLSIYPSIQLYMYLSVCLCVAAWDRLRITLFSSLIFYLSMYVSIFFMNLNFYLSFYIFEFYICFSYFYILSICIYICIKFSIYLIFIFIYLRTSSILLYPSLLMYIAICRSISSADPEFWI